MLLEEKDNIPLRVTPIPEGENLACFLKNDTTNLNARGFNASNSIKSKDFFLSLGVTDIVDLFGLKVI